MKWGNRMFCRVCGSKISDDAKFCPECGAVVEQIKPTQETVFSSNSDTTQTTSVPNGETRYASTALKAAVFGLVFWCCCGFQLIAGIPAIWFGVLAIRNNEPEVEKAYLGMGLGVLDIIGFIVLILFSLDQ